MYLDSLNLKIDSRRCLHCGACVRECVNGVLRLSETTSEPEVAPGGENRCIHCAHCLMACPAAAFSLDGLDPADFPPLQKQADFDSVLGLVRNRRSVRHYKRENADPAALEKLRHALQYFPTGVNYRKLHYVIIDDLAVMDELRRIFYDELGTCGDDAARAWAEAWKTQKRDIVFRSAPHMILAAYDEKSFCGETDCVIALTGFEMLANALGLGTVWFGRLMTVFSKIKPDLVRLFHLPEGYRPGYAMLFGRSSARFYRTAVRETATFSSLKAPL